MLVKFVRSVKQMRLNAWSPATFLKYCTGMSNASAPSVREPHKPGREIQILHECDNFLIVNKPADLRINSNEENEHSVATAVAAQYPHLVDSSVYHSFRFVHRLDYSTSGVLCLALNPLAAGVAGKCFDKKRVVKHYVALVRGHVLPGHQKKDENVHENESFVRWEYQNGLHECQISVGLGRDNRVTDICKMCEATCSAAKNTKHALTRLIVLQHGTYQNQPASKVLLIPVTGRTHQLRVHCRYIGHLIVGDFTYSDRTDTEPYRMMLHSTKLMLWETKAKRKKILPEGELHIRCPDPFNPETDPEWSPSHTFATYTPDLLNPVPVK